jgi:hypothetical protein
MPVLRNKSAGPRILNVVGGDPSSGRVIQRTLMPGEAAEVELLPGSENDVAFQAMMKSDLEEVGKDALEPAVLNVEEALKTEQEAAEVVAKARTAREAITAAELDLNRMTVPRQFGSDGGPAQVPTVDNRGGALTQSQQEQGRQEPPLTGSVPDTLSSGATPPAPASKGPGRPKGS